MWTSVRPDAVLLFEDHFTVEGSRFDYTAVDSIRFVYVVVTILGQGKAYQPDCDVHIRNQLTPIKMRLPLSFLSWAVVHTEHRANALIEKYRQLAAATFEHRLNRYLRELQESGYFLYSKKRFTSDGEVLDASGSAIFDLKKDRSHLLRYPFYLKYRPPSGLLKAAIRATVGNSNHMISTEHDADVFFPLLKNLYGLSWSK